MAPKSELCAGGSHSSNRLPAASFYGADLKHVAPTIVTANASKVEPSSTQRVDLSTPKAYRVYASNGAYVTYTVTAYTEEPSAHAVALGEAAEPDQQQPQLVGAGGIPEKDRLL